jgi:topoisomerase IA-like protein
LAGFLLGFDDETIVDGRSKQGNQRLGEKPVSYTTASAKDGTFGTLVSDSEYNNFPGTQPIPGHCGIYLVFR